MKANINDSKVTKAVIGTMLFSAVLGSAVVYAQDDASILLADEALNSQQIDVDGAFERKAPSAADRIAKMRQKLEEKNEQMVRKKIEDVRIKEEQRMTNRLANMFNGGGLTDTVQTTQAAPKVEAPVPTAGKMLDGVRLTPNLGVTNIKGDKIDFESKVSGGISVDADVTERIAVGGSVSYSTLDITDIDGGYYNPYNYGQSYYNYYGQQGRELSYKHLNLEMNTKFFLSTTSRIRPYAGLGVGYNRASLKYKDQRASYYDSYTGYNYGEEQYSSSYVSASAAMGMQIAFSETIGMGVEAKFTKGITSGYDTETAESQYYSYDQDKLNRIGGAIEDASFLSVNAGLIVAF